MRIMRKPRNTPCVEVNHFNTLAIRSTQKVLERMLFGNKDRESYYLEAI